MKMMTANCLHRSNTWLLVRTLNTSMAIQLAQIEMIWVVSLGIPVDQGSETLKLVFNAHKRKIWWITAELNQSLKGRSSTCEMKLLKSSKRWKSKMITWKSNLLKLHHLKRKWGKFKSKCKPKTFKWKLRTFLPFRQHKEDNKWLIQWIQATHACLQMLEEP